MTMTVIWNKRFIRSSYFLGRFDRKSQLVDAHIGVVCEIEAPCLQICMCIWWRSLCVMYPKTVECERHDDTVWHRLMMMLFTGHYVWTCQLYRWLNRVCCDVSVRTRLFGCNKQRQPRWIAGASFRSIHLWNLTCTHVSHHTVLIFKIQYWCMCLTISIGSKIEIANTWRCRVALPSSVPQSF